VSLTGRRRCTHRGEETIAYMENGEIISKYLTFP
jgi:hypothetical protein